MPNLSHIKKKAKEVAKTFCKNQATNGIVNSDERVLADRLTITLQLALAEFERDIKKGIK